jgi:hypothetical protein
MEPFKDDNDLIAELRAQRPQPRPQFTAELDERAAAGFPRRSPSTSPLSGLAAWVRALSPRRLAFTAGATALAGVAIATAVVAVGEPGSDSPPAYLIAQSDGASAPAAGGSVQRGDFQHEGRTPPNAVPPAHSQPSVSAGAGVQYEEAIPSIAGGPGHSKSSGTNAGGGGGAAAEAETVAPVTGPYATKAAHRDVERAADLVLGAENAADVGNDSSKIFETVHAYDGIVLSSSIRDGEEGEAGAQFELLIPGAKLGDALDALSTIDEVRSRHQATTDITAPTVGLDERLQDSGAKVEGLLEQLAGADTDAERAAAEAELRAERRHAASLRSQLSDLQRRASLSKVSLRIESGGSTSPDENSSWGAGDALDDAGHILGIAAGVAIVGLAILAPLALIALLVWLANHTRVRRRRERTLD